MTDRPKLLRTRQTKIVATLGPSSSTIDTIRDLFTLGVDVFRFNYSHGSHEDHADRMKIVRDLEKELNRPIAVDERADPQFGALHVGHNGNRS
ncbi:MAG: pyruvate kinase, partial [Pseudomonadota bacterium]